MEPFGWPATNITQAMIRSTLVRMMGGEKAKKIKPEQFLLDARNESPLADAEEATPEMITQLLGVTATPH